MAPNARRRGKEEEKETKEARRVFLFLFVV